MASREDQYTAVLIFPSVQIQKYINLEEVFFSAKFVKFSKVFANIWKVTYST